MNVELVDEIPEESKRGPIQGSGKWAKLCRSIPPGKIIKVEPDCKVSSAYRGILRTINVVPGFDGYKVSLRGACLYISNLKESEATDAD